MITHISRGFRGLLFRQVSASLLLAMSTFLYGGGAARAEVLVDDFSDTINTMPFPFRLIQQTGPGSNSGVPAVETGLTGVIGGSRQTTVSVTAGASTAEAAIFAGSPGALQFTNPAGMTSSLSLNYNNNGAGLGANVPLFAGVSIPFGDVALGASPNIPVMATLTDAGANAATAMALVTTEGAQTLIIPAGAFAGLGALDLTNIASILLNFGAGSGTEFVLNGPIQILLVPEPLAILGWSVVLVMGLAGWRYLGPRVRAA